MQTQDLTFKMKYPVCFSCITGLLYFIFEFIISVLLCYTIFFNKKISATHELIFNLIDISSCFLYACLIHCIHIYKIKNLKQMFKNTYIICIVYLIFMIIKIICILGANASFKKGLDIIYGTIAIFGRYLALKYGHNKKGIFLSVFLSGVVFGMFHMLNLTRGIKLYAVIQQSIAAFAVGCFFAGMYLKSGNLWETILIHFIIDFHGLFEVYFVNFGQTVESAISEMGDIDYITSFIRFVIILLLTYIIYLRKSKIENLISNVNSMRKDEFNYI